MDVHSHKCSDCGNIWTHDRDTIKGRSDDIYKKAHTCSECGETQFYRHDVDAERELGPKTVRLLQTLMDLFEGEEA